jgi:predicted metal-dependent hydrolase
MSVTPTVRNLSFEAIAAAPHRWHGGRAAVTTFFDNLSIFFPVGERFFMKSVRAHESAVTDPALRAAVRAFHGQEGVHGREHQRYNDALRARGYPVEAMEERVRRLLAGVRKVVPPRLQLAATCALEHFTALMGESLLADPAMLDGADPAMAALWRWHAAEENEHKAVAFDVFVAAGGTYGERAAAMALASVIFWAKVLEHQVRMMKHDGNVGSLSEWAALARYLFVEPGGLRPLLARYLDYYRPNFHPDDVDTAHLVDAWARASATAGGDVLRRRDVRQIGG